MLVSWLYALYSFDYKWSLTSRRLQERIAFFEQHWAFFLGAPALHTGASACVAFLQVHTCETHGLELLSQHRGVRLAVRCDSR